MSHDVATAQWSLQQSRFEFAPPRHFLLPAILLLLSEKPGYGYNLVKDLHDFRFGQVERPAVYRALAQLEGDGLVTSWDEPAKAGQGRRVYGITESGTRVLRCWMGVVKEERDCLDNVLHRYQSTGTADSALAQVDGVWRAALGHAWSPVSSTCATGRLRPPSDVAATVPTSFQMPLREVGDGGDRPSRADRHRVPDRAEPDGADRLPGAGATRGANGHGATYGHAGEAHGATGETHGEAGDVHRAAGEAHGATGETHGARATGEAHGARATGEAHGARATGEALAAGDAHGGTNRTSTVRTLTTSDLASSTPAALAAGVGRDPEGSPEAADGSASRVRCRFRVVPDRSVILIEARSTVGPMRFGAMGLTGEVEVSLRGEDIDTEEAPVANLCVPVDQLRSGNGLYDAELLRRVDARRFPRATLKLEECSPIGTGDRYRAVAEVVFHGSARRIHGTVGVKVLSGRKLVVTGDHALDVRDFQLPSPTVLMLRIYPDVRINLHVEAEFDDFAD